MRQVYLFVFYCLFLDHSSLQVTQIQLFFQDISMDTLREELPERQPRYPD